MNVPENKYSGILLTFCILITWSSVCSAQTLVISDIWKFKLGDSLSWARADYNDASWADIKPGRAWEEQGYKGYDGYAWYRAKVVIPSGLKSNSSLSEEISINVGGIDNYNQCFLNGKLIGQNSETVIDTPKTTLMDSTVSWRASRVYTLSCNDSRILWDHENVFAIRVFDVDGNGGIWSGSPNIKVLDANDFISITAKDNPFTKDRKTNRLSKNVTLSNASGKYSFTGKLTIKAENSLTRENILDTLINITLSPGLKVEIPFSFTSDKNEIVRLNYSFKEQKSGYDFKESEYAPYCLTPETPASPRINNPSVFGVKPGHPVFFKIPATGEEPKKYLIRNLPKGLNCDIITGLVTGILTQKGDYKLSVTVSNKLGSDSKEFTIKVGDTIALTPPMGWNSYYCSWNDVTGDDVKKAATLMKQSGLIEHGYTYINMDDGWPGKRDANGNITQNEKFGNMKDLGDYIHSQGLKYGIYNSPGIRTCGGYTGTYQHEFQDLKTYESWGVDYLKYDWCSYDDLGDIKVLVDLQRPYLLMQQLLANANRDIVYSICQYGMGDVWTWGRSAGGNLWRTTFDITDSWGSLHSIAFQQYKFSKYASPGGWNDPDMLLMGWFHAGRELHPSNLTIPEQYSQFTLWSLLSAPLILSCDFSKLDDVTLSIIANDEVIAIDQDSLGKAASLVSEKDGFQVYLKELHDGSKAVGVFNLNDSDTFFNLNLNEFGFNGKLKLRDVWRQSDIKITGLNSNVFLPAHGSIFYKITSSKQNKTAK